MDRPAIQYAWRAGVSLAYQVLGAGPIDLAYLQGYLSNVELNWEHPALARFLRELAGLARLIIADRRGLGLSERFTPADTPPTEVLMDDVAAVLDAANSARPVIFATGDWDQRPTRHWPVDAAGRIAAEAEPDEILVSGTVKELVAGGAFEFRDRARHKLKGLPNEWPLYAVS